ncbi:TPA: N-6 DNA methylase [Streptococcus equi subsp. zooepidemicus]|uniref:Eco57I restriction-modification methylase domain-containing protein n=1 Tax=Megasphaera sp. UPII 135-E TaxID=1000569 RepID=UPI00021A1972|nr:N-6 DNA methylase [Megasphaera sp. UPII 135-E]HEL0009359.1 N-6 DNA methylase [Streptococcus equi subsp. zooepidemicus]EGS34118.1 hypothetical protein HMPREF1040_0938 [Megasphaera sp. UPII 135-E]HEL0010808.1 N-6 DNA methylase [Streptococcus equi subsp. zooepidemicus]HEL0011432.1 N-6 DNA methylase [Streptococcus equi subsp. zooepidemicus]HEL0012880.1 N-6 DNA methylase [Streptococcus equi subsp. zooepidemicus]
MNVKSKQTEEKLNGVFYTPFEIVDFLTRWITDKQQISNVLEPSAGDGRFVKQIVELADKANVTAVEIDPLECEIIKAIDNTKVINDDFYNFYEEIKDIGIKYDAVIGNPPYIRYQFLSEEQRNYQSDILKRNGMKPNKLINSWVAFTVASIELLSLGGKFAFVLPTDLLQVSYAKELRKFIFKELKEVTIIRFDNIVFSGIQQDVVLIFGIKRDMESKKTLIRNISVKDMSQLSNKIYAIPFEYYDFDNSDKWRKFLLSKNFMKFYEDKFINETTSIKDISTIEVGITTGNNKVFVVNNETVNKYSLDDYKVPLVGRSLDVFGLFYTENDISHNSLNCRKVWLLDFNNRKLNRGAKKYIKEVESRDEHKGYKLGLREKWYEVPSIWIPDAFLLRRMGNFPKIVKNEIKATSTDTFHRIRFNEGIDVAKTLVSFYSSVTLLSFELEGRVFGGGALEILPGDLKNIRLPKINDGIDFIEISKKIDEKLRANHEFTEIVKWVDSLIQSLSGFNKSEINEIYDVWNSLRRNRVE